MQVAYKEMTCDGPKFNEAKWNFEWWNTIQAREKMPNVPVVQWLGMFWSGFGRCFNSIWWNVSFLVCALWVKKRKKHVLT